MRHCPKKYPYVHGDKNLNQIHIQAQNQGNQMQQHYMHGKVNNVTMDDVQNNPDVILGMFLLNST